MGKRFGDTWGYTRLAGKEIKINGWRIGFSSFEFTAPEKLAGKTSYRYRMSKNDIVNGEWRDKNSKARLFDRKYFTTLEEAKEAAIKEANK